MTVEDTPSAPVTPPAAASDRSGSPVENGKEDVHVNGVESADRAATAAAKFVWAPPPREAVVVAATTAVGGKGLCCDLCPVSGFANEMGLKSHQIRLHLNPSHLSDEDRSLVSPAAVKVDGGDVDGAVYRCHLCLRLCEEKVDLRTHLTAHAKERPEDFEDVEQRPSSLALQAKTRESKLEKHFKVRKKRESGTKKCHADPSTPPSPPPLTTACEDSVVGRPERKCKTNTNALVAINIADERLEIDFERDFLTAKAKATTKRRGKANSGGSESSDNSAKTERVEKAESTEESSHTEAAPDSFTHNSTKVKDTESRVEATGEEEEETEGDGGVTQPAPNKSKAKSSLPGSKGGKKKKKGGRLTKKPAKKRKGQMGKKRSKSNRKTEVANSKLYQEISGLQKSNNSRKMVASIEDILPDLKPTRPVTTPRMMTKRLSSETARAAQIVRAVTAAEEAFTCLECGQRFEDFVSLTSHKDAENAGGSKRRRRRMGMVMKYKGSSSRIAKSVTYNDEDYSDFISKAIRQIPENTFNNMHGSIRHVDTVDGLYLRSRGGSELGTLEKVRMNVSEPWTTKDVWEYGAWEVCRSPLSWHRYESVWEDKRRFLERMSSLAWPVQARFKGVYDAWISHREGRRDAAAVDRSLTKFSPQSLELKQVHRSVKYMTAAEREARKEEVEGRREVRIVNGEIRGEWELEHSYMCAACAEPFDELREVMHHKWDAHPYCVVAHVTLQSVLNIPPNNMMYPQLGKGLRRPPPPGSNRRRSSKYQTQIPTTPTKCTKCGWADFREEGYAGFAAHLLECGGHENWDDSAKRSSAKKGKKSTKRESKTEEERARERIKREERFARFDTPRVHACGSRTTRFKIAMVQKEEEEEKEKERKERESKSKNTKKSRAAKKGKSKKQEKKALRNSPAPAAPSPPPPKASSGDPESGTSSPLPDRPRRSTVNYARDRSLRDGAWVLRTQQQEMEIENMLKEEEEKAQSEDEVDVETLAEEKLIVAGVKKEAEEGGSIPEKVGLKRRASCSLALRRGAPPRKASRLSLDSEVQMESRPLRNDQGQRGRDASRDGARRTSRKSPSPAADTPTAIPASNGVKLEQETKDLIKEEDEDDAPLIRLKNPAKTRPKPKPEPRPGPRPEDDYKARPRETTAAVKRRRSTLDDGGVESPSRPSPRKKRVSSTNGLASIAAVAASSSAATVFPVEVKLAALDRMSKGDTPSAVAKDLQCPVSTVSSWWYRRSGILSKKAASAAAGGDGLNSSGEESPDSRSNGFSSDSNSPSPAAAPNAAEPPPTSSSSSAAAAVASSASPSSPRHITSKDEKAFALIPYERNLILERMRERVEDAFKESGGGDDATTVLVVTEGSNGVPLVEEERQSAEEAAESSVVVAVPTFAEEEKAAALDRCESRVSTASTGLSLIFDNYQDDDDGGGAAEESNS